MKPIAIILLSLTLIPAPLLAEDDYSLEKIVIKRGSEEIKDRGMDSPAEILNYTPGIDLRQRGPFGVQGDLSMRGSTYEQVLILIDGIRINDPQTGHHNLDIPLTSFDIEKILAAKQGSSALYGPGALAGSVNIITKKPSKKNCRLETGFGEYGLYTQAISAEIPGETISSSYSFEHKTCNGARPNTDFDFSTYSSIIEKSWDENSLNAFLGYQDKDFGADSFYSNLFKEEEEHTKTLFTKVSLKTKNENNALANSLFLRKHDDKFLINRHNPSSFNKHTTYSYGLDSKLDMPIKIGELHLGAGAERDEINSTNLGKNTRLNKNLSFGLSSAVNDRLDAEGAFRIDDYQNWKIRDSSNLSLSYRMPGDNLKLNSSFSQAFRVPSFTELYYSDAANKGNSDLKIEKSDNFTVGMEGRINSFKLGAEGFFRKTKNLIDWTRATDADAWQATNLGSADFRGIDITCGINTSISASYVYTEADRSPVNFLSKYALDILKHQAIIELKQSLLGMETDWQLSYNERKFGETYFVGNVIVKRSFKNAGREIEPFLKIDNFTDTEYSEVGGVLQPGRWIQSGIKIKW